MTQPVGPPVTFARRRCRNPPSLVPASAPSTASLAHSSWDALPGWPVGLEKAGTVLGRHRLSVSTRATLVPGRRTRGSPNSLHRLLAVASAPAPPSLATRGRALDAVHLTTHQEGALQEEGGRQPFRPPEIMQNGSWPFAMASTISPPSVATLAQMPSRRRTA